METQCVGSGSLALWRSLWKPPKSFRMCSCLSSHNRFQGPFRREELLLLKKTNKKHIQMTQPECERSPSENPPKSPSELERTLSFLYIRQNMNLIMTSFLYWRASAAVWTGRGAFSQQCHHHSCISKASLRFLPGDKRLILKQPRLTSIRQSQEWTTSINVFLFSLLHFFFPPLYFSWGRRSGFAWYVSKVTWSRCGRSPKTTNLIWLCNNSVCLLFITSNVKVGCRSFHPLLSKHG